MKVVILAGGSGTRLWPLSRQNNPKQVLSIIGRQTMLQDSYRRLRLRFKAEDILVATGEQYKNTILKQLPLLPKENILIEPARRGTAGAVALAAVHVYRNNPDEILASVHADNWVADDKLFSSLIKFSESFVKKHHKQTLLMGIKPAYPETGYGYIQIGKKFVQSKFGSIYKSIRFVEKPGLKKAEYFVMKKKYFWNPGWFVWQVGHLFELYKKYAPAYYKIMQAMASASQSDFQKTVNKKFVKLDSAAIDNLIIEKEKDLLVLPIKIGWSDIGHWRSVKEMSKGDRNKNVCNSPSLLIDSANNLLLSDSKKFIAGVGINGIIMIETKDAILLATNTGAHETKKITALMSKNVKLKKFL